jgi:hypothetical protein
MWGPVAGRLFGGAQNSLENLILVVSKAQPVQFLALPITDAESLPRDKFCCMDGGRSLLFHEQEVQIGKSG